MPTFYSVYVIVHRESWPDGKDYEEAVEIHDEDMRRVLWTSKKSFAMRLAEKFVTLCDLARKQDKEE